MAGERELDGDEFHAELASHISGRVGVNRDVLVFVHGFNTSFDEARARAAQIVADSRFGGVAVLFTWPTKQRLFGYASDKDSAMASRDALQALLQDISATPGVGKIHVLAHSMGGWLAMEALSQASIAGNRDLGGRLGEVMLASPDIDMDVFAGADGAHPAGQGHRLRHRQRSRAVAVERDRPVAQARRRDQPVQAGRSAGVGDPRRQGLRPLDVSDGFFDHGAYADAPDVLHAIGAQMATPRAQDAGTMSIIDARGYADPAAPAPATPAAVTPSPAAGAPAGAPAPPN